VSILGRSSVFLRADRCRQRSSGVLSTAYAAAARAASALDSVRALASRRNAVTVVDASPERLMSAICVVGAGDSSGQKTTPGML
jgi:hypothetical protein